MAGTALLGRLAWRIADIEASSEETLRTKTLAMSVPGWPGHLAGQHVDVRLTAEDGYQTERSYSIASAAQGEHVEITVERLEDGEVSPYLADVLLPGDKLELRGPIGVQLNTDSCLQLSATAAAGGAQLPGKCVQLHTR